MVNGFRLFARNRPVIGGATTAKTGTAPDVVDPASIPTPTTTPTTTPTKTTTPTPPTPPTTVGAKPSPWAWYDAQVGSNPSLRHMREAVEKMIPADLATSSFITNDLIAAMVTKRLWSMGTRAAQDIQADLKKRESPNDQKGATVTRLFSKLGPGFEKLGQLLGNRPDLVDEAYRPALRSLSEAAAPIRMYDVESALTSQLEARRPDGVAPNLAGRALLNAVFKSIDPTPLGVGSIGQAHAAELIDGTKVVVKIVKPGIAARLQSDFQAILDVVEANGTGPLGDLVREMERQSLRETDLRNEAQSLVDGRETLGEIGVGAPRVWEDLTGERVLVMEFVPGTSGAELGREQKAQAAKDLFEAVVHLVKKGKLHGDPHRGNVRIASVDATARLSLIDWGLTAELPARQLRQLGHLIYGMDSRSEPSLMKATAALGFSEQNVPSLREIVARHANAKDTTIARVQSLLLELQLCAGGLPGPLVAAAKSLMLAEGVARELDPKFEPHVSLSMFDLLPKVWRARPEAPLRAGDAVKTVARNDLRDKINEGDRRVAELVKRVENIAGTFASAQAATASRTMSFEPSVRAVVDAGNELAKSIELNLALLSSAEPLDKDALAIRARLHDAAAFAIRVDKRAEALDVAARTAQLIYGPLARMTSPSLRALQERFGPSPTLDAFTFGEAATLPNLSAAMAQALELREKRDAQGTSSVDAVAANVKRVIGGGNKQAVRDEISRVAFVARDRTAAAERALAFARALSVFQPERDVDVAGAHDAYDRAVHLERDVIAKLAKLGIKIAVAFDLTQRDKELASITPRRRAPVFAKLFGGATSDKTQTQILALVAEAQAALH